MPTKAACSLCGWEAAYPEHGQAKEFAGDHRTEDCPRASGEAPTYIQDITREEALEIGFAEGFEPDWAREE